MRKGKPEKRIVYMCGVAWQHEAGETDVKIYASAAQCERREHCTKDCGIVKAEISLVKWIVPQKPISEWSVITLRPKRR
jgi:hypothetical protein